MAHYQWNHWLTISGIFIQNENWKEIEEQLTKFTKHSYTNGVFDTAVFKKSQF